jgi:hypothetical protein
VPPLPAEPEEQGEVEEADTKELIRWLEEEGITPYLAEAYPDTLNTDVRLIKAAKRLRDCAKILEDMTCAQFERLVRILDGHIPEPTYLAQVDGHQVKVLHRDDAVIAVLSGEWAQALACYVEVCTDEFYMPYDRAVKSCMRKYVNVIEKEPTISEDQDLIINLLEYVHKSANSLKSDSSIYWTEDST